MYRQVPLDQQTLAHLAYTYGHIIDSAHAFLRTTILIYPALFAALDSRSYQVCGCSVPGLIRPYVRLSARRSVTLWRITDTDAFIKQPSRRPRLPLRCPRSNGRCSTDHVFPDVRRPYLQDDLLIQFANCKAVVSGRCRCRCCCCGHRPHQLATQLARSSSRATRNQPIERRLLIGGEFTESDV